MCHFINAISLILLSYLIAIINAMIDNGIINSMNQPNHIKIQWKQLLSSSQLISKDSSNFPSLKTCRLRMTYSKLQHNNNENHNYKIHGLEATRGSFLLGKSLGCQIQRKDYKNKKQKIFYQRYSKNKQDGEVALSHTIDAAKIKNISKQRMPNNLQDNKFNSQVQKYQNFNEYLKKIVISQKANYDISKFYSEGKGMQMTDRGNFEKLQRLKLSILNRKMQQKKEKNFHCVSTKLNFSNYNKMGIDQLPQLPKKNISNKKMPQTKSPQKQTKKPISSFQFDPWESDQINNDFYQQ